MHSPHVRRSARLSLCPSVCQPRSRRAKRPSGRLAPKSAGTSTQIYFTQPAVLSHMRCHSQFHSSFPPPFSSLLLSSPLPSLILFLLFFLLFSFSPASLCQSIVLDMAQSIVMVLCSRANMLLSWRSVSRVTLHKAQEFVLPKHILSLSFAFRINVPPPLLLSFPPSV